MIYKTINIIIPYFGKFPNYFQLFLNSCGCNRTIDWTIITDNTESYMYPSNVKKVHMSFEDVQQLIRSKFDFELAINSVHKLCEFKPAYGFIFDDFVKGYDFWGYGDLDLIYGDIRSFLSEKILSYDKIFTLGHFSLIKNTYEINRLFMKPLEETKLYRIAFSSDDNYNFDEEFNGKPNINTIFRKYGYSVWSKSFAADIYTKSNYFILDFGDGKIEEKRKNFFALNESKLYRFFDNKGYVYKKEYLYIHLQKRNMCIKGEFNYNIYKIIPNSFERLEVEWDSIKDEFDNIKKQRINNQYLRIRCRNLKIKIKKCIKKYKINNV